MNKIITSLLFSASLATAVAQQNDPLSAKAPKPATAVNEDDYAALIRKQVAAFQDSGKAPLEEFYKGRKYRQVWTTQYLDGMAEFIRSLDEHGLNPAHFQLGTWEPVWRKSNLLPEERVSVEVGTTRLALEAIQALAYGFVDPTEVHPKWKPVKRAVTASQFLNSALRQPPARFSAHLLNKVPPQNSRYQAMIETLSRFRKIQSFGGWKPLPAPGRLIRPGMSYPELNLLKARLQAEGDLPQTPIKNTNNLFEQTTSDALKSFQFRHGITPNGDIGPDTLQEINQPNEDRIATLIINLDRLRWLPRADEQPRYVEVNLAEGALRVFNRDKRETTMKIAVGKAGKNATPIFHDRIDAVIFRPSHTVHSDQERPESLMKLSLVGGSSLFFGECGEKSYFSLTDRDVTTGNVCVSRPDELAMIALGGTPGGWNIDAVRKAMNDESNPDNKVDLGSQLPVYMMYRTASIMGDGRVRFDQDIYGLDTAMLKKFGLQYESK